MFHHNNHHVATNYFLLPWYVSMKIKYFKYYSTCFICRCCNAVYSVHCWVQEFAMYILTGIVVEASWLDFAIIRIAISGCIQITLKMPSRNHTSLFWGAVDCGSLPHREAPPASSPSLFLAALLMSAQRSVWHKRKDLTRLWRWDYSSSGDRGD